MINKDRTYDAGLELIRLGFVSCAQDPTKSVLLCSHCGPVGTVDEDGCCVTCGGDAQHWWHVPTND